MSFLYPANATLPPLPSYTLSPQPPLISRIPDKYLSLILIIVAYWGMSLFFHIIDVYDLFPQYRLHTPEEVSSRNHVSRWDVFRDVIIQQVVQTAFGVFLGWLEEDPMVGKDAYNVSVWAQRIRQCQAVVPYTLGALGFNALSMSAKVSNTHPELSGFLAGGQYNFYESTSAGKVPAFASWETLAARSVYYFAIPAAQFLVAILIVDTWQYFWHRAMHLNKWLYSTYNKS